MLQEIRVYILALSTLCICYSLYLIIKSVYKKIRYGEKMAISFDFGSVALFLVALAFCIKALFFGSTTIGSFWEYPNYTQDYEAVLYIEDKAIFSIAELERCTDEGDSYYTINKISLPFGKVDYPESEYDPQEDNNYVSLGTNSYDCIIILKAPAKKESYHVLRSGSVAQTGEFCASKKEDVFHYADCRHVKKIKRENLIYFETTTEAEVFGYYSCFDCNKW